MSNTAQQLSLKQETRNIFHPSTKKKRKGIHAYINQDGFTNVRLLLKNNKKKISTTHCVWRHPFLISYFLSSFFKKENGKKVIQVLNLCQPQLWKIVVFGRVGDLVFLGTGENVHGRCNTQARTRRQTSTKIRTMRGTSWVGQALLSLANIRQPKSQLPTVWSSERSPIGRQNSKHFELLKLQNPADHLSCNFVFFFFFKISAEFHTHHKGEDTLTTHTHGVQTHW